MGTFNMTVWKRCLPCFLYSQEDWARGKISHLPAFHDPGSLHISSRRLLQITNLLHSTSCLLNTNWLYFINTYLLITTISHIANKTYICYWDITWSLMLLGEFCVLGLNCSFQGLWRSWPSLPGTAGTIYKFPENFFFVIILSCFTPESRKSVILHRRLRAHTVFVDLTEFKEGYLWDYFCDN